MKKILTITAILIFSLCNLSYAATAGLWTFDEASGNTAYDSSGYGNNGTIYGATRTPGLFGGALSFDGVNDYIDCGDTPSLDVNSAITLGAWIKAPHTDSATIISKDDDHGNREYYLGFDYGENGIRWALNTPPPAWHFSLIDSMAQPYDQQWHNIVATYDGSYMRLYIDGVEDSFSPVAQNGLIPNTQAHFRIGAMSDIGYEQYFRGIIDNVSIYNTALTAEEIRRQYNSAVPEPASMLLFSIGGIGMALIKRRRRA